MSVCLFFLFCSKNGALRAAVGDQEGRGLEGKKKIEEEEARSKRIEVNREGWERKRRKVDKIGAKSTRSGEEGAG